MDARRFAHYRGKQVDEIVHSSIGSIRTIAPLCQAPILKIEDDNYDPKTESSGKLWCLAISAKRYALFVRNRNGEPELLRPGVNIPEDSAVGWSEHGLGHLLNPIDPTSEDRSWIAQTWLGIVRRSLGLPTRPLPFADRVALGQNTVSSPEVLRPLSKLNAGKPYAAQIKPFNFILSCHVAPYGHPADADPERFHLIAPYETDPRKWLALPWIDQYSGKQYRISTTLATGTRQIARVKSYGDVLEEYEFHEEAKCTDGAARLATSKPWGCCSDGMWRLSGRRASSAKSRTSSKRSRSRASQMRLTFILSILIRGATSG